MHESEFETALEQLRTCIISRNDDTVAKLLMDLDLATVATGEWPVGFFQGWKNSEGPELPEPDEFLESLVLYQQQLEQLSAQEQARLRQILADAFDNYGSWMGAFVTSEILGEHYADEATLAILARLAKTARLPARAAVPHALETLAKTTQHEPLRGLAIRQLQELQESNSRGSAARNAHIAGQAPPKRRLRTLPLQT